MGIDCSAKCLTHAWGRDNVTSVNLIANTRLSLTGTDDMTVADGNTNFSQYKVSRRGSELYLYPRFMSHHQLIPTTLGFGYTGNGCNATNCTSFQWPAPLTPTCSCDAVYDSYCADNAAQFYQWGLEDERVVAVLPFFWYNEHGSVGLQNLPQCLAEWQKIGREVIASRAGRPPAARPSRGNSCPGALARGTPPPAAALVAPGTRNWCANS